MTADTGRQTNVAYVCKTKLFTTIIGEIVECRYILPGTRGAAGYSEGVAKAGGGYQAPICGGGSSVVVWGGYKLQRTL